MTERMKSIAEKAMPKEGTIVSLMDTFDCEKDKTNLIPLPYKTVTAKLGGGLRRGFTSCLSGPPGNGKSFFAYGVFLTAHDAGIRSAYIPLEYCTSEHIRRMMAVRVCSWSMVSNTPDKALEREEAFTKNIEMLKDYEDIEKHVCENPYTHVDVGGILPTFDDILDMVKMLCEDHDFIIIDPITAIMPDPIKKQSETQQQTSFCIALSGVAAKLKKHIMVIGHTGKRSKYNGKPSALTIDDMSGSAAYQRFINYVMILDYHEEKTSNATNEYGATVDVEHKRTLLIEKTNFGSGKGSKIAMDFKKSYGPNLEDLGWI
jgi:predicted ATP-dependent serine protease